MATVQYRVSQVSLGFMVAIAAVFDLLQFLLTLTVFGTVLTWFVTMFAVILFAVWFLILGVNYFSGRKAALKVGSALTSVVIEFVPIINALPSITVGVVSIALVSRMEDRIGAKKTAKQQAQAAREYVRIMRMQAANDNQEESEYREAA